MIKIKTVLQWHSKDKPLKGRTTCVWAQYFHTTKVDSYHAWSPKLFIASSYKVMKNSATSNVTSSLVKAVLDSKAGSSLVREDLLPTARVSSVQQIHASIKAVGNKTFSVEGVTRHTVKGGGHKASKCFGVAAKLATKMISETVFINRETLRIETNHGQLVPKLFMYSLSPDVLKTKLHLYSWVIEPFRIMMTLPRRFC